MASGYCPAQCSSREKKNFMHPSLETLTISMWLSGESEGSMLNGKYWPATTWSPYLAYPPREVTLPG